MTITATCGHILKENEGKDGMGFDIMVKDYSDGIGGMAYIVVCEECLRWYKKHHMILKTEKSQQKWMAKKRLYDE